MSTATATASAATTVKQVNVPNLSRQEFIRNAGVIPVEIGGRKFSAEAKEFSTGSLGWFVQGSFLTTINGTAVKVQIGCNLTVANSKLHPAGRGRETQTVG